MKKICNRRLTFSEITWKILTLDRMYRNQFPKPNAPVSFIDENGLKNGGKMHSSGLTRIDGLGWWYKGHPSLKVGTMIGVYKDDNNNYIIKSENSPNEEEILEESFENEGYEEDFTSLSLEKDLENALVNNLTILEDGLGMFQPQYPVEYEGVKGIIDILAKDKDGSFVVVELKAGVANEKVCGQILKYIALIKKNISEAKEVRGMIIANEFDNGLKLAVSNLPNILLKKYNINFTFEDIK